MNPVSNPLPANVMPTEVRTGDGVFAPPAGAQNVSAIIRYVIEITREDIAVKLTHTLRNPASNSYFFTPILFVS